MSIAPTLTFDNSYIHLPEAFYARVAPTPVSAPSLIRFNIELADALGMDISTLDESVLAEVFSGNTLITGSEPLAMAYSGHQFGQLNPHLGDGRAILLGEMIATDQLRYDLQLKGAGQTPFSRRGDGRAALGPVLREYLLSEAMHRLGVPTTRALAAVSSGELVYREQALPGGIITRVSRSFVRVGTFQHFAIRGDVAAVKQLADYVIERLYPSLADADYPYLALLETVIDQQARLVARWMQHGFIHGVMNTDNMSIAGETIDYGPCAFIDDYHPAKVFSSIDHQGRYAYQNQPAAAHWDLCRLAEALIPLLDENQETAVNKAQQAIHAFAHRYDHYWLIGMAEKLGLSQAKADDNDSSHHHRNTGRDHDLINALLDCMSDNGADFTLTFYHLSNALADRSDNDQPIRDLFVKPEAFDDWAKQWRERLVDEPASDAERQARMHAVNPLYIPRNHLVAAAIRAAEDHQDFAPFHAFYKVLMQPYTPQENCAKYAMPPAPHEVVHHTFCGT